MKIIAAIDIIEGKCVRLTQGDYREKKVYSNDPLEVAKEFEDNGIRYLHMVDLEGAKGNRVVNFKTIERVVANTSLKVDFGGGIKNIDDLKSILSTGVKQITVGSIALQKPNLFLEWLYLYGEEKIVLGADCKEGLIAVNGWMERSEIEVESYLLNYQQKGVKYAIVTDIERDGMLRGPSFELYKKVLEKTKLKIIASGGICSVKELKTLAAIGCDGAIIGKALYEGSIKLKELSELC